MKSNKAQYDRIQYKKIKDLFFKKQIIIIYGARQVGKSTLSKLILKDFNESEVLFLSCDDILVRSKLENVNTEQLMSLVKSKKVIVIDEAQMVVNIGVTLKLLADNISSDVQIIATGSSSFDLANKINEPLTGRNLKFFLYPLSLSEISSQMNRINIEKNLSNFMLYGMYPSIVAEENVQNKILFLKNLTEDYLFKDILNYDKVKNTNVIKRLTLLLALRVGSEISYPDLAVNLGVSRDTVAKYVDILEQAFIIFRLRPFYTNKEKEINKTHKIYFYDTGIRNALLGNFDDLNLRSDTGAIFENFFIAEYYKKHKYSDALSEINFWKSYGGGEIDLVESFKQGQEIKAFECKYTERKSKTPKAWQDRYPTTKVEVINRDNVIDFFLSVPSIPSTTTLT